MSSARDNTFVNKEKRMFYIHDYIDEDSISKVCYELLNILDEDDKRESREKDFIREPIKMYINSVGGCTEDMWALVDIMLGSRTPVYTYSTSYAHSAAFKIFIAGSKRYITKHTSMLCHQFSGTIRGEYQALKEKMENLDRKWEEIEEYVCSRTNISKERMEEIKEKKQDWYIYSEELIELGVATDFITEF